MKISCCLAFAVGLGLGFAAPFAHGEGSALFPSLRQLAEARNFKIGATRVPAYTADAGTSQPAYDPLYSDRLAQEFNILTQEGPTYFSRLHPNPPATLLGQLDRTSCDSMFFDPVRGVLLPEYNFLPATRQIEFANSNGIHVRNHTLVWHEVMPEWLFARQKDATGRGCSRVVDASGAFVPRFAPALNREIMVNHIKTVMQHFRMQFPETVFTWDVVNEAIDSAPRNPNGRSTYEKWFRDTLWSRVGATPDEYIKLAFTAAYEADPRARLFYNENGSPWEQGPDTKFEVLYTLMKNLKAEGVPIHGVGFQMHLRLDEAVDYQGLLLNMLRLQGLGLEVQITELDVKIPLQDWNNDGRKDAADEALVPQELLERQATAYRNVLRACLRAGNCTAFVSWGFTDRHSWITARDFNFGAALPLDRQYGRKPAYQGLVDALLEPAVVTAPRTIEAVGVMQYKDKGVPTADGRSWRMPWNGAITETVCFQDEPSPSLRSYRIDVRAQGTAAGGVWPLMEFHLKGQKIKTVSVASRDFRDYGLTLQVAPGCYPLTLKYVNDAMVGTEDRDLVIDRITIQPIAPDAAGGDSWGLYRAEHELTQAVCTNYSGTTLLPHRLELAARGSPAVGVWPVMDLFVNGQKMRSVSVSSATPSNYGVTTHLQQGCYAVTARLANDYYAPPEDRNIWISKVGVKVVPPDQPSGDNWALYYQNGEVSQGVCLAPSPKPNSLVPYRVRVGAKGSPAAGVWPLMELRLNGGVMKAFSVASSSQQLFGLTAHLQPGCYSLALRFTNDLQRLPEDRNLWIGRVDVIRTTATDPAGDSWNLYNNADEILQAMCVSAASRPYRLAVSARGAQAAGVWPLLGVSVNGAAAQQLSVASTAVSPYSVTASAGPGCHRVSLRLLNDFYRAPEDRNIWITGFGITPVSP